MKNLILLNLYLKKIKWISLLLDNYVISIVGYLIYEIIMAVIRFNKVKNPSLNKTTGYMKINKNYIFFSKYELTSILNLYSKQVSKGFWKDYALDSKANTAIFSIYKHSHDRPIYQIIKKSLKGFRNVPDFFITKDTEIINKSSEISIIL